MKEKELLTWIDGQIEGTTQQISDLVKTAQLVSQDPLDEIIESGCRQDLEVLKDLREIVYSWYRLKL